MTDNRRTRYSEDRYRDPVSRNSKYRDDYPENFESEEDREWRYLREPYARNQRQANSFREQDYEDNRFRYEERRNAPPKGKTRRIDNYSERQRPSKRPFYEEDERAYYREKEWDYRDQRPNRYENKAASRRPYVAERLPRDFDQPDRFSPEKSEIYRKRPISAQRNLEKNWEKEQKNTQVSRQKKIFSMIYNLFFYTFTIGLIIMALMFSFSAKNNASIFGYRFYTVLTDSMVPQKDSPPGGFYAGDIVFLKVTDMKNIKNGDVVTYAVGDQGSYLTHRLVKQLDELNGEKGAYVVTKGDANKSNDPPIPAERVIGKVVYAVPKLGRVIEFIRSEFWLCLLFLASTFGFFLILKAYLFSPDDGPQKRAATSRR